MWGMTDAAATDAIQASMPLCRTLGVAAERFDADRVVLTLDWSAELCTAGDLLHGGALMALADAAGGACAFANLPADATGTSTIESKTNFLGAVRSGRVTATATPLKVGGSTIVVETTLVNDDRLVAKTTQTQIVLR